MKTIQLTKGMKTIVDDEDYNRLNSHQWYYTSHGYAKSDKLDYMHRFILNAPVNMEVDHINGNRFDNRKCNLRLVSKDENLRNTSKRKHSTNKYKGVRVKEINFRKKPYYATITINKKKIHLGYFKTEIEAAWCYDVAALKYHGEFAKLNFPMETYQ